MSTISKTRNTKSGVAELYNKGVELEKQNKFDEAMGCFEKALEIDPEFSWAWSSKGDIFKTLGKPEKAIKCYDEALKIDPEDTMAYFSKAGVLEGLGKVKDAIICLDKALDIDNKFVWAYQNKGFYLKKLGKYQEAIEAYQHVIKFGRPEDAEFVADAKEYIYECLSKTKKSKKGGSKSKPQSDQKTSFWKRLFNRD